MTPSPRNVYSRLWFSTFLGDIDAAIVSSEVAFVTRQLPRDHFSSILDLCCGPGRHLAPLVDAGYALLGVDIDTYAIQAARAGLQARGRATFVRADMRDLPLRSASLDAVICMWQSFGHFDEATNQRVLSDVTRLLGQNGRVILDVYHRDYYARRQGERRIERYGVRVVERRWMEENRLRVALQYEYDSGGERPAGVEEFDWQLYTPDELIAGAERAGLRLRLACSDFDEVQTPSADSPRMQLVFERLDGPAIGDLS